MLPFQWFSPFFVFGIPISIFPDMEAVESVYFQFLRKVHPDKVRHLLPEQQEQAALYAGLLNASYKTIKNPALLLKALFKELYPTASLPLPELAFLENVMQLESEKNKHEINTQVQILEQQVEDGVRSCSLKEIDVFITKLGYLYRIQSSVEA